MYDNVKGFISLCLSLKFNKGLSLSMQICILTNKSYKYKYKFNTKLYQFYINIQFQKHIKQYKPENWIVYSVYWVALDFYAVNVNKKTE